ncbi:hypothetical protein C8J57DRAFT_1240188 [Mycena rebaudengoi]|nr:hypothetical protein C8J57DRAFT_1240188 [Mycena rebaudengoi]
MAPQDKVEPKTDQIRVYLSSGVACQNGSSAPRVELSVIYSFPTDDSTPAKGQESNQRRADIDEEKNDPSLSSTIEHTEHNQESTLSAGWKVGMPVKAILMIYLALNSLYEEAGVLGFYAHSGLPHNNSPSAGNWNDLQDNYAPNRAFPVEKRNWNDLQDNCAPNRAFPVEKRKGSTCEKNKEG